jgi:hypothetical protein
MQATYLILGLGKGNISLGIELLIANTIFCGFDTRTCTTTLLQMDSCYWRVLFLVQLAIEHKEPAIECICA